MKIIRAVFESYDITAGQFFNSVLFIQEKSFNATNIYEIMRKRSHIVCGDMRIDQLIAANCLEGPPEIVKAYEAAVLSGHNLEVFPYAGRLNLTPFIVPRFGESDFESIIEKMGGRKIPETTVKTPDFEIASVTLELKDLQTESLLNKDRQQNIAKLYKNVQTRTIDLQTLFDDSTFAIGYKKFLANTIKNHVKKASEQSKSFAADNLVKASGLILLNTGSFSLAHETLKSIAQEILSHHTRTITFMLLFTQKMQSNGLDTYATYACEFIGNTPADLQPLKAEVKKLIDIKMKEMIVNPQPLEGKGVESMQPLSFLMDGKIFFWNPGRVSGGLTSAFERKE